MGPSCSRKNAPSGSSTSHRFRTRFPRRPTCATSFSSAAVASRNHPSISVTALLVCTFNRLIASSGGRHFDSRRSCTLQTLLSVAFTFTPFPICTIHSIHILYLYIFTCIIAHSTLAFPLQHSFHFKSNFFSGGNVLRGHRSQQQSTALID